MPLCSFLGHDRQIIEVLLPNQGKYTSSEVSVITFIIDMLEFLGLSGAIITDVRSLHQIKFCQLGNDSDTLLVDKWNVALDAAHLALKVSQSCQWCI